MDISIQHQMRLEFQTPAGHAVQHLLVTPLNTGCQTVRSWSVEAPGIEHAARFTDAFGNVAIFTSQTGTIRHVDIALSGVVQTLSDNGVVGKLSGDPVPALFKRMTPTTRSPVSVYGKFRNQPISGPARLELLHALMARIHETVSQAGTEAEAGTPQAEDYAHGFVGAARALGIPARYVSGYLAGPNGGLGGPHAWAEAWDDGLGWVGFDAMHDVCPTERYVRLAAALDAQTAAPVRSYPPCQDDGVGLKAVEIEVAARAGQ